LEVLLLVKWQGAAGICLNEDNELLMVLQGTKKKKHGQYHQAAKKLLEILRYVVSAKCMKKPDL